MFQRKYVYALLSLYLCSTFHMISADEGCDKSKCKGPLKYYEDLGCTPTYSVDTCCPAKYNCDHLDGRSKDKCHYKGHVYDLDQTLRAEDAQRCDIGCICKKFGDFAQFQCAAYQCPLVAETDCYLKESHTECCDGPQVCPICANCLNYWPYFNEKRFFIAQNEPETARCEVDGKTYFDGQRFTPSSDATLSCICGAGYTGENVSPFCKPMKPHTCGAELRRASDIYDNCAPAFYTAQNPATDCHLFSRCQREDDGVMVSGDATETGETPLTDPIPVCTLGQLRMNVGEQLKPLLDNSICLKCLCDVPPLPTCYQVAETECAAGQS